MATINIGSEEKMREKNLVNDLVGEYNALLKELGDEDPRHYIRRIQ